MLVSMRRTPSSSWSVAPDRPRRATAVRRGRTDGALSEGSRRSARARPCRASTEGRTSRPCSSHVYQVVPTPASSATSSRRRPGVRRRVPGGRPTSAGDRRARRERRKSASACWRASMRCSLRLMGSS